MANYNIKNDNSKKYKLSKDKIDYSKFNNNKYCIVDSDDINLDINSYIDNKIEDLEDLEDLEDDIESNDYLDSDDLKTCNIIDINNITKIELKKEKEIPMKIIIENIKKKEPMVFSDTTKIYDIININGNEYFFDKNINLLLDYNINPIGFFNKSKYILYDDLKVENEKIIIENQKVERIINKILFNNKNI